VFYVILVRSEALLSLFVILNPSEALRRGVKNLGAVIISNRNTPHKSK
jgi:hypothetical protein